MLLPVQDIRALEYKAKLTSEFDWQKANEQFNDGSIITRLRAGIDSGADISTVELDD